MGKKGKGSRLSTSAGTLTLLYFPFRTLSDMFWDVKRPEFSPLFPIHQEFFHHIFFMEFQTPSPSSQFDWRASDNTIFDGWIEMMKIDESKVLEPRFPPLSIKAITTWKLKSDFELAGKIENSQCENFLLIFEGDKNAECVVLCVRRKEGLRRWLNWSDRPRKWKSLLVDLWNSMKRFQIEFWFGFLQSTLPITDKTLITFREIWLWHSKISSSHQRRLLWQNENEDEN